MDSIIPLHLKSKIAAHTGLRQTWSETQKTGFVTLQLIVSETPSETAARTLKLIAKALQNLANLVEFGVKVGMGCIQK